MAISESGHYDLLDQLAEELAERLRRGERPSLEEYTNRYPELAEEIRELFPAMVKVEQAEALRQADEAAMTGDSPPANLSLNRIPREIGLGRASVLNQAGQTSPVHKIGDYRILREIGRGGMGVVYEAEQISLGRRVALKVLPRNVSSDRLVQERFRREARAAARLHHTNIVPVYEVGHDGDVRFYAMQFIQGQGLDTVIAELRRFRERSGSRSKGKAPSRGQSLGRGREHAGPDIEALTVSDGVEVGAVVRSMLSGRFDPGGRGLEPAGTLAGARTGGIAAPTGTERESHAALADPALQRTETGSAPAANTISPERAHPSAPASSPFASPSSTSAILPGGTQVSSVESGRRAFFRSLAQIGRQVAGGLAYAHARGIVHRDIKPSNLLLDTDGVVWIADFGLAKGEDEGLTQSGDILGTLRYMSPERFRGDGDARADVYALGLTLYELLALRPGFDSSDRLKLIEQIKTEEPQKPRSIDARIPRDLETIVLKAIEKDPKARYQTAEAMGEDLRRFLADEPIRARQVSAAERYWRWARRNPVVATLGGVLTALLVVVTIGSLMVARRYASLAAREGNSAAAERSARLEVVQALETAEKAEREATEQKTRADSAAEVAERNLFYAQMHLAQQAWRELRGLPHMRELLVTWIPKGNSPDRRGWEWFYLNSLTYQNVRSLAGGGRRDSGRPCFVAWQPANHRLASCTNDDLIRIWDVNREQTILTLRGAWRTNTYVFGEQLAWSPKHTLAAGYVDGTVHVWDTTSGREVHVFRGHKSEVRSVAFNSDGGRVAACAADGTIKIWDSRTGRLIDELAHPGGVTTGVWAPDEKHLACGHFDGTVTISGTHAGDNVTTLREHNSQIHALAWSPDSKRLASTSFDHTTRIWDVASEKTVLGPLRHSHEVTSVAWEPNGERLATGSIDETVKIWSTTTGQEVVTLRGHAETVTSLAWQPDGLLASGGDGGSVRIWTSIRDQESSVLPGHVVPATSVSWSPDGTRIASGGDDGDIRIWDTARRVELTSFRGHDRRRLNAQFGLIRSLAWSPDGTRLASGGMDGAAKVWEAASGRELFALPADRGSVWSVAWSPDGTYLAAGSQDGTIRVVEGLEQTQTIRVFKAHEPRRSGSFGGVRTLAWSPQGNRLASGGLDGLVKLWDPIRRTELARLRTDTSAGIFGVAWSPDGKRLAATGTDSLVITWDVATCQTLSTMRGHTTWVDSVAWSPDGTRLASAGYDNTVRISDPSTGEETLVLGGNSGWFHNVTWHPDGAKLAAANNDGQIWIWDATRGFERDTTPRALPYIDRKVASGTARGDDLLWFAESYFRAGKPTEAVALLKEDPARLRAWFAKLPADEQKMVIHLSPEVAKMAETPSEAERIELEAAEITKALGLVQSGVTFFQARKMADAIRDLEQARDLLHCSLRANPDDGSLASQLSISLGFLGNALSQCKRPVEALAALQEQRSLVEGMQHPQPIDLYNLACTYAQLSVLVEHVATSPASSERADLAARGVETLTRAVSADKRYWSSMDQDHDLDPLRSRTDFRALMLDRDLPPDPFAR
jgi:eukaryotic-like serine/threonine-protein kinase